MAPSRAATVEPGDARAAAARARPPVAPSLR